MSTKNTKKPQRPTDQEKTNYPNGWSVLGKVVEEIFALINNNKIYVAFSMMFFLMVFLIIWRLPESEIAPVLRWAITQLGASVGGLFGLLVATNLGWKWLYNRQRDAYQAEIKRLIDIRHDLMHGKITPIVNHRSTDDAQDEVYLLPPESGKRIQKERTK